MQLDLNLLTALDALLDEGSVGGAAARLHVTSPAMSRTLNRIRDKTGDQILVRVGRYMTPTQHALTLRDEVHAIVQRANTVLAPQRELDLAALERSFTIQCHDAIALALAAALIGEIQASAPRVTLRLLAEGAVDTNMLRRGEIDLAISATAPTLAEIHHETIGYDRLVVAMRPDHPLGKQKLTIPRYANAKHLIVSRRGRLFDPVDELLAEHGKTRTVVASAPNSTTALNVVSQSDMIVAVHEKACRATIALLGLRTSPLPLTVSAPPLISAWHSRFDSDRAHAWMRGQVRKAAQVVFLT